MPSSKVGIPILSAISARMSKMTRPSFASSYRMPRRLPSSTKRVTKTIFNASMMPACSRAVWPMGRDTTACARYGERQVELEDPYRFPPILSEFDLYLLGEGTHVHLYEKLGAHPMVLDEVSGVAFAVFAPAAKRVSVIGDFNLWNGRRH